MSSELVEHSAAVVQALCMPAAEHKITITLRVDPEQHRAWVAAADREDRSLSSWAQRCCDAAAGYVPPAKSLRTPRPGTKVRQSRKPRGARARKAT